MRLYPVLAQIPDVTGAEPALARTGPGILAASLVLMLVAFALAARAHARIGRATDALVRRRAQLDARERLGAGIVLAGIAISTWSRMHFGHDRPVWFMVLDFGLPIVGVVIVLAGAVEAGRRVWGSGE